MPRVDYSELVEALAEGDGQKANRLLEELVPRLREYLRVVMGADERAAAECVQQAFLDVFEQIKKQKIRENKYIFSYLLKACRHEYLRYQKQQNRFSYEEATIEQILEPADQIRNLLDQERQAILSECLDELDEESREFIVYFIDKPDTTTKEASNRFNLSSANVRTKKSRITSRLHDCYRRKSER